jgi:hypothetical protein
MKDVKNKLKSLSGRLNKIDNVATLGAFKLSDKEVKSLFGRDLMAKDINTIKESQQTKAVVNTLFALYDVAKGVSNANATRNK